MAALMAGSLGFYPVRENVYAAEPSIPTNIFHLKGEEKTKADNAQKVILEILKMERFKTTLTPYIGPAVALLDV
jgi:hypothetical protein